MPRIVDRRLAAQMLIRPLLALGVCVLSAGLVMPAQADSGRDMRSWLMRIHDAANHRNFQGTFVVSGGGSVVSSRIAHFCDGRSQFERIESLDGQPRQVYRHNDLVHTFWPASRIALLEQRDLLTAFPALLQAGDDHIHEVYDVQLQAGERVAGREADVLWVKPRDAYRYGYRLWADKASGLLLRSDMLDERMEVLETAAFSDVAIGVRPQIDSVLQPMKKLDGYRVMRPLLTPTSLEDEGWALRQSLPGFRQVRCVKRPVEGATTAADARNNQLLQTIYSDGLTHVSVFIEPYDSMRHTKPLLTLLGATQTMMVRQGDWWITVMGDVPTVTLRAFANGLERRR